MKEYLNENTLFATVAMFIKESTSLLLVVEGDDDHLVLKDHCSPGLRLVAGVGGREQVLRAAALARRRDLKGVRFLVDRDYDEFTGSAGAHSDNVCVSNMHDLFMDIAANDPSLLQRVIAVHTASASRRKDDAAPALPAPRTIEAQALSLASHLAAVRIVNARRNLQLDFKRFSFGNLKKKEFDTSAIANMVMLRSGYDPTEFDDVVFEALVVHQEISRLKYLPVGDHDLFSALARVLKLFKVSVSAEVLQKAFIMGVSCSALNGADWFDEIQAWCARNSRTGFDCLPAPSIAA